MDLQITCIIFRGQAIIFSGRDFQYPEGVPGDSDDWKMVQGNLSYLALDYFPIILSDDDITMRFLHPADNLIRLKEQWRKR
jgi:hypothetical protein